jgi:hypothetical protein
MPSAAKGHALRCAKAVAKRVRISGRVEALQLCGRGSAKPQAASGRRLYRSERTVLLAVKWAKGTKARAARASGVAS